jgi:Nuclease-related domain
LRQFDRRSSARSRSVDDERRIMFTAGQREELMQAVGDPTSRTAGQHARAAVQRLRLRTLVTLGVLAVATALLGKMFGLHDARFLIAEVALLASMFVISRYVLPLVERRDRGATAEEHVGHMLDARLPEGWQVIHDASLGRGNVDHVVIGPAGVFTVETKSHPGPVRVGRVHGATIRQAQAQRKAIEDVTGVSVEPLVVFSRAWVDRPLARRKGVRVLPARMLIGHLAKRPEALSPKEIEEVRARLAAALLAQEAINREARVRLGLIR